jgi:ribosomal subunit interface protein
MRIQVYYQGIESSPWMEQFITKKVGKLERYVSPSASIKVYLKAENKKFQTNLVIFNLNHEYSFTSTGENLYEAFSEANEKALRSLGEHKRKLKDKINRKFFSLRKSLAF